MSRARENISLTQIDYDIAGNSFRAYYDKSHNLVFVLDETITGDKPNVLLVIDSFDGRKWDDVLANDYHVDLETVRPKRDNKYQKLDIEYGGLDVYANLISADESGGDVDDALGGLTSFRAMAVRRSATERLNAAEETISKSHDTIERTNESINELRSKMKDLRNKLVKQRGSIGREPTKASAAKILKIEAQIDATNEKLARAKKRLTSAQHRLSNAEDDAEIARAILARDVPVAKTSKKASRVPAVQKPQSIAVTRDVPEDEDMDEDEVKDDVKPLFDKDPENLDDTIAFKPIDFGTPELPKPTEKQITSSVPDDEIAPAPLSFTPPVSQPGDQDDFDDAVAEEAPTPMLDSLSPVSTETSAPKVPLAPIPEPVEETAEPVPVDETTPAAPEVPVVASRPLPPVVENNMPVAEKPQKTTLLYYVMLVLLIILSIGTLWIYQKKTADNVPDLAKTTAQTVVDTEMLTPQPADTMVVTETPTPFIASTNVVKATTEPETKKVVVDVETEAADVPVAVEEVSVAVEPVVVATPTPDVAQEPMDEPVIEESPFIELEPVAKYEPEPANVPSAAEVMASKPGYNVSQNEKMFVAADNYETETGIPVCEGGVAPNSLGCCPGEEYTYTEDGFMCCNSVECFPPVEN
ncbi:MAG: hypothetical protein J5679_02435 [Alphaproteobacteria bacterium]|nr:hypothetical protein [Alphaproteobacteria bacterium]